MLSLIKDYAADVFNLFYPHVCLSCSSALTNSEQVICYKCESELPETGHWNNPENKLQQRLWGRVNLQGSAALYQFHKGTGVQELLHNLKYRKRKDVGAYLGNILGQRLMQQDSIIQNVDAVIPVPLHWKKEKERGYNQCDCIAEGISNAMQIPVTTTAIERVEKNVSQTGKNRFERWDNVASIFAVKDAAQIQGKHILLVDDVVTTGATAEACLHTILSVPDTKVSFAAVAFAML